MNMNSILIYVHVQRAFGATAGHGHWRCLLAIVRMELRCFTLPLRASLILRACPRALPGGGPDILMMLPYGWLFTMTFTLQL